MKRNLLALSALFFALLACMQQVPTTLPTDVPTRTNSMPTTLPTTLPTTTPAPANELLRIHEQRCLVVTASETLHLRRSPSEHSEALDWLRNGTILSAYILQNDWWMVKTPGGKIGYVKDEFVEACQ